MFAYWSILLKSSKNVNLKILKSHISWFFPREVYLTSTYIIQCYFAINPNSKMVNMSMKATMKPLEKHTIKKSWNSLDTTISQWHLLYGPFSFSSTPFCLERKLKKRKDNNIVVQKMVYCEQSFLVPYKQSMFLYCIWAWNNWRTNMRNPSLSTRQLADNLVEYPGK